MIQTHHYWQAKQAIAHSLIVLLKTATSWAIQQVCSSQLTVIILMNLMKFFLKPLTAKRKNYAIYCDSYVEDNMGFNCSCTYESDGNLAWVYIKVTDDDCTIQNLCGKIESVKLNGVDITSINSEYHIDKTNGSADLDIRCSNNEPFEFYFLPDLAK